MSAKTLLENLKKDKQKNSGKYQKSSRPKREVMNAEGNYKQRLLPNKQDPSDVPYTRVFLHFGFTHPNFGTPSTFRCLGKNCPLCREAKEMQNEKRGDAWRYKSTPVYLYYITDSSDNFKYIRLSQTAHTAVYEELTKKAMSNVNPLDYDKGRVALIQLEKVGNKNKWSCTFLNEVSEVSKETREELDSAPNLDELYRVYSADDLELVAAGKPLKMEGYSNKTQVTGKVPPAVLDEEHDNDENSNNSVMHSAPLDDEEDSPSAEEPKSDDDLEKRRAEIREKIRKDLGAKS